MEPQDNKPAKGYGKRPKWQWAVIYVIVATIVYVLIYFLFIREPGSSSGGGLY
ncbi:MAG: hypothetical protein AAB541_02440 [Patescibacteria group bacterium]